MPGSPRAGGLGAAPNTLPGILNRRLRLRALGSSRSGAMSGCGVTRSFKIMRRGGENP